MSAASRIAFVITDLGTGGAEMGLLKQLTYAAEFGIDPLVISLRSGHDMPIHKRLMELSIPVIDLGMRWNPKGLASLRWLAPQIRKFRPDVLVSRMYHANVAAAAILPTLNPRPPLFWSIHHVWNGVRHERVTTSLIVKLGALYSSRPQKIAYMSQVSADSHARIGYDMRSSVVIPNGFDDERFCRQESARRRIRSEWGIGSGVHVVGYVGRDHFLKNIRGLCRAIHKLRERWNGPPFLFVFAGRGLDQSNRELQKLIAELQISSVVRFLGPQTDVPALMSAFDSLVLPSLSESFPNVLAEAMLCELPCVVSDVGACREILLGNGEVVPPRDEEALVRALERVLLLSEFARRELGAKARASIQQRYHLRQVAAEYFSLWTADPDLPSPRCQNVAGFQP